MAENETDEQNQLREEAEARQRTAEEERLKEIESLGFGNGFSWDKASKELDKHRKAKSSVREAKRKELSAIFQSSGFAGMPNKPQDIIIFVHEFGKGRINLGNNDEYLKKIADVISIMPENGKLAKWRDGKWSWLVDRNRRQYKKDISKAAKRLQRLNDKYAERQAALDYKFKGADAVIAEAGDVKITAAQQYLNAIEKRQAGLNALNPTRWVLERRKSKVLSPKPRRYELKNIRAKKENKIKELEKSVQDGNWFNRLKDGAHLNIVRWRYRVQEQKSMKTASQTFLDARREAYKKGLEDIDKKLYYEVADDKGNKIKKDAILTDREKKLLLTKAQQLNILLGAVDSAEAQRQIDYGRKTASLAEAKATALEPVEKRIIECYDLIQEKNAALEKTTPRGKLLIGLLERAPEGRRKYLEAVVNGKTEEMITDDAEFKQYIQERLEMAGMDPKLAEKFGPNIAETIKKHKALITTNSKAEEQGTKNESGTVNDGQTNTPPSDNKEWHQSSEEVLQSSYNSENYEKVVPEREGQNADNDNVLYQTFRNKEDEHVVTIEKPDDHNYNISAKDKNGEKTTPTVEDLKHTMEALKQEGHTSLELGTVKSPEFLARAMAAAEEAGIEISNLDAVKKQMADKGLEQEVKTAVSSVATQQVLKGAEIDVSTPEGLGKAMDKMDALVWVRSMKADEYQEFKKSDLCKDLKLNPKEEKLFDNLNKLSTSKEFANEGEEKRARLLGRMVSNYQSAYTKAKENGTSPKEVKKSFIKNNAAKFNVMSSRSGAGSR